MTSWKDPWTCAITGAVAVLGSEVIYLLYKKLVNQRNERRKLKRVTSSMSNDEQELEKRKPGELWNTAIFWPDNTEDDPNSPTGQLIRYFESARMSIHLCLYLTSHPKLTRVIKKKFDEGLVVQVVTDWDTFTAHNNFGPKSWKRMGIQVRMKATGFLMHHKFAVIDEEAVVTGSLNWTKQGIACNQENLLITTNKQLVAKYLEEFHNLWLLFEPGA